MANLAEVLDHVRSGYVDFFRAVIREQRAQRYGLLMKKQDVGVEVLVETGGGPKVLFRPDLLVRRPGRNEPFKPVKVDLGPTEIGMFSASFSGGPSVTFRPFAWCACPVAFQGPLGAWAGCSDWYEKWFDCDDKRPADADGLHGVIHEMSAPQPTASGFALSLDLGSSSTESLLELFHLLHQQGVSSIQVG